MLDLLACLDDLGIRGHAYAFEQSGVGSVEIGEGLAGIGVASDRLDPSLRI